MMEVPQFPLGSVLFPTMTLPLRIFEDRYKQMLRDVLEGDGCFGVVLIERGSEAGGGDVRSSTGVLASLVDVQQDGDFFALLAVGTDRYRVSSWLPDDPYPRAEIELWPDDAPLAANEEAMATQLDGLVERLETCRRRITTMHSSDQQVSDAGEAKVDPPMPPLSSDLSTATMQLSALLPVGPFDHYRLLNCAGSEQRLTLLDEQLGETEALLQMLDEN